MDGAAVILNSQAFFVDVSGVDQRDSSQYN
jgi:hypothetical protein